MATMALTGLNITFPIKNADGTAFHDLVLRKATVDSVVMSLGDKITGDVYYRDNTLSVTMQEYVEYNGVKYSLVNPPTIVREGMVSDNSELRGMTKYSFEFYHPMYMLGNFPFTDIAVNGSQEKYLSQNKTFSWIGYLADYVAKLNKNLEGTQWVVVIGLSVQQEELTKLSEVLSFDNATIADALKTGYETWKVPYVVDAIASDSPYYAQGKRFMVQYGLPTTEIVDGQGNPFVFHFGKGVGLKNNSRTPRNNKIITRIAGYGSENNIPYGYPQIVWTGNQDWDYTINNDPTAENSYPIYKGIVGGAYVKLIKHPFTRTHLMPSIYSETVNKKVNPYAIGYDPTTEIKDYYDADNTYDNPIKAGEPSYEIHAFEDIKPELTSAYSLQAVVPYDQHAASQDFVTKSSFLGSVLDRATSTEIALERAQMLALYNSINNDTAYNSSGSDDSYEYSCATTSNSGYFTVIYKSSNFNFTSVIQITQQSPEWDDTMDEDGNYVQSYFQITLPQLTFDIYACAAITEEMKINMRSGACIGCTFPVQVDWDDYKKNFYDSDGNFAPTGAQRDYTKYPDSSQDSITILVQKENDTFGTLMPNIYQKPQSGDKFVILGISLPLSYITSAESRLDDEMKAYMRENNVYYYDYPLKFDEHFLATYTSVLNQMKNNVLVRFDYAGTQHALYIKQMTVKYGDNPLPQYDITLTDDIEVVLNQIGQAVEDISNLHSLLSEQQQKTLSLSELDARYIRKDIDDDAAGIIRFVRGMQVGERFVTGLLGEGGIFRRDADGKTYIEADKLYIRMKAYFDTVEIRKYQHSSGNRIASNAGIRCSRVEYIDSNGNITTNVASANIFRCYFKASEDDKTITNDFVVGDLAFCSETNVNTGGLSQHRYWRAVVDKSLSADSNGEHYIDLSVSDCETGSGIPIAQDDIVQLGNKTDNTRQGAIIEFVSGDDAPSYQIYQGINTYSLNNKNYISMGYSSSTGRAYLNVYGDFRFGARPNTQGSYISYNSQTGELSIKAHVEFTNSDQELDTLVQSHQRDDSYDDTEIQAAVSNLADKTDDLQAQIDGQIESWFYNGVPSDSVLPESDWKAIDIAAGNNNERLKHLGDMYYDNQTGYAYRYSNTGTEANPTFVWTPISDSAVVKALADAAAALGLADTKAKIFTTASGVLPNPPYKVNDIWVNATGTWGSGSSAINWDNEILKCVTAKTSNQAAAIGDWAKASKYTDDTRVNGFINELLNGQTDTEAAMTAAIKAIRAAVNDGKTTISGGLVLTNEIAMRDTAATPKVWSGISGMYDANVLGGGIASWWGGARVDHEVSPSVADYAKSLIRFDGSGYFASGNITWDKDGIVTIANVYSNVDGVNVPWSATTLQYMNNLVNILPITYVSSVAYFDPKLSFTNLSIYGNAVATQQWVTSQIGALEYLNQATGCDGVMTLTTNKGNATVVDLTHEHSWFEIQDRPTTLKGYGISADDELLMENFLTIAFFNRLFQAHNGNADVNANDISSTIDSIEAMFGFWTEQYISALGKSSGGGSGIGDVTWDMLADNTDTRQIALSHLTTALTGYATQSWVNTVLSSYATQSWVNTALSSYATQSWVTELLSSYATKQWVNEQGFTTNVGTVTSVATGIGLTGGTITSSGTIAINSEYQGYISNGNTAYGWGNHALAGYATTTQLNALEYLNQASGGDGVLALTTNKGNATIIDLTHEHSWFEIQDRPTTLKGLGISADDELLADNYLTIAFFSRLFRAYNENTEVTPNDTASTIDSIKAMFGFWTEQYISALGQSSGSGGGVGDVTWELLADNTDTRQIALSHLTTALTYYATQSWVTTQIGTLEYLIQADGGDGVMTLTTNKGNATLIDLTHEHSWFEIQDRPTTLVAYGVTSDDKLLNTVLNTALNGYLPLTGGTITGGLTVNGGITTSGITASGNVTASMFVRSGGTASQFLKADGSVDNTAYTTNVGTVTSVGTGTGLTGGTITVSGTISINSEYQGYISNGNTAYGWGNHATFGYATVTQLNALEFLNQVSGGDGLITLTTNKSNSTVLDLTHQHSWFEIQDRPTTILGYGITDGVFTGSVTIGSNELNTNYRLTVNGNTRTNRLYLTDSVYLEYNSTTGGVHVVGAGLYSDTFISALGASTGTAGGVGDVTWDLLASNSDTRQIALSHLTSALSGYATRSWVGENYLSLSGGTIKDNDYQTVINADGLAFLYNGIQVASCYVTNTIDGSEFHVSGGTIYINNTIQAGALVKSGGTSTQFLKADGSVDEFTGGNGVLTLTGSGTQIDLTHQHSWFEIRDKPDTFQGFGIKGGTLSSTLSLNRNVLDFADNIVYANAWKVVGTSTYMLDFWGAEAFRFHSRITVAGSVTATEYITSSDLQKKDIVEYVQNLTVYNVADAPLFRYTWKNSKDKATHIGTAAQYWQTVTPELVHVGMDTFLTMQYDVIALASAITVARTVVSHEERITILEKENEALRKEIEKLKAA